MTKVKICGITDATALDTAVQSGADWIGLVFFPPSPRFLTAEAAAVLSARIAGEVPVVGLFVEPSEAVIADVLAHVRLDVLQIYGALDRLPAISQRFGLPIWRAVGVSSMADLPIEARGAERLVLEAKPPSGADRPGGNATPFDWGVLRGWTASAPWILAGGLTPGNVAAAIRETGAEAVDVSSGVEIRKGIKDPALIRAFIAAAKGGGNRV